MKNIPKFFNRLDKKKMTEILWATLVIISLTAIRLVLSVIELKEINKKICESNTFLHVELEYQCKELRRIEVINKKIFDKQTSLQKQLAQYCSKTMGDFE